MGWSAAVGAVSVTLAGMVAVLVGSGETAGMITGELVLGAGFGAVAGAACGGLAALAASVIGHRNREALPPASTDRSVHALLERRRLANDPWAGPVERCERSVRTVLRVLAKLPPSAAGDWLESIAESMADKLPEVGALADTGRLLVPGADPEARARAERHELYARLVHTADSFAAIEREIGRMVARLQADPDLGEVRAELETLATQLPVLRSDPA